MKQKIKWLFAVGGALVMLPIDYRLSLGWSVAWFCLLAVSYVRERFYEVILDPSAFSVAKYIQYIIFVFAMLWLPLLLAFMFSDFINPYSMAAAYLLDRLLLFIIGIFTKEKAHGTS